MNTFPLVKAGSWAAGVALGVALVGPAWSSDALLNLDLVVFDRIPISPGFWGLGPEIPRQSPIVVALAIASRLVDGPVLVAALMIASVASAFVGVIRLCRPAPWHARVAAGMLYSLSPWLATRLAVGHLGLVFAAGILPWVLATLLRPDADLRRTFLAATALGLGGYFGGSLALIVLTVGLVTSRGRDAWRIAAIWVVSQLPWLVPGTIVSLSSPRFAGGEFFDTALGSLGDGLRLVFGYGFWQRGNQLGLESALIPFAALIILGLTVVGARSLPANWGWRAGVLAATATVIASAGSIPLIGELFDWATSSLPGAVMREPQRALVLALVWLAPATGLGIARIEQRHRAAGLGASACCAIITVLVISPAVWGLGGRLHPLAVPEPWTDVRDTVQSGAGTTLALPWNQYVDLRIADGRRTYLPVSVLVDGDVINSSDPEFGPPLQEAADPREATVTSALAEFDAAEPLSTELSNIGVRWIVVIRGVDDSRYDKLRLDPGLQVVIDDASITLYELRSWKGSARTTAGVGFDVDVVIPPIARVRGDGDGIWYAPSAPGWSRNLNSASTSPTGLIEIPEGSGPLWYWPSIPVIAGYMTTLLATLLALLRRFSTWWERVDDEPILDDGFA